MSDTIIINPSNDCDSIVINPIIDNETIVINGKSAVSTVNGRVGDVVLNSNDVGLTVVNSNSANWDASYSSVYANSALWTQGGNSVALQSLSSTWNSNYITTNSLSSFWDSVYTNVNSNSGNWNISYNVITDYQSVSSSFATNTLLQSTSGLLTPLTTTNALTSQLVLNSNFNSYQTSVAASTAILLPTSVYQNSSGLFVTYIDGDIRYPKLSSSSLWDGGNEAYTNLISNSSIYAAVTAVEGTLYEIDTVNNNGVVKLSFPPSVVIPGDVNINGTLFVQGSSYTVNTQNIVVNDPLIYIAEGNLGNLYDIGFVGAFDNGLYQHTGFVRNHLLNKWTLFSGMTSEPLSSINTTDPTFTIDTLQANIEGTVFGNVSGNISGNAGSVTNGVYTNGSYSDPSWISSLADTKIQGNNRNSWDSVYTSWNSASATSVVEYNDTRFAKLSAQVYQSGSGVNSIQPINGNNASGNYSNVAGGGGNTASGYYSNIAGGYNNIASGNSSTVSGGGSNTSCQFHSTISGGYNNIASGSGSTVSGGYSNIASSLVSTVAGGGGNTASGYSSNVAGGYCNTASGWYSNVAGGQCNIACGCNSNVAGGFSNTVSGYSSNVAGGSINIASGINSTVSGGYSNTASGINSTVSGGYNNAASGSGSLVSNGSNNSASGDYSGILGGRNNNTNNQTCSFIIGQGIIAPQPNYTYVNNISSVGIVEANGGNSDQWNNSYNVSTIYQNVSGSFITNSGGVSTIRTITQANYNLLNPPDPNTLYIII